MTTVADEFQNFLSTTRRLDQNTADNAARSIALLKCFLLLPSEARAMGAIILKCPTPGLEYASSLEMDELSFVRSLDLKVSSRCPKCGGEHVFTLRDARLNSNHLAGVSSSPNMYNQSKS